MSSEVQIAVIDQQDTQIVLAVPGVQGATGSEIAAGGTANQVLRKASSTDYDTDWSLVTNAMVDSSAAIAGTKISPNFGSQAVVTTGTSTAASFIPTSNTAPTNGLYLSAANNVAISSSGTQRVNFGTGEVVFNETGENYDFRIEGDTEPNLVFVDASTNRVGLGTSSPSGKLDIVTGTTGNVLIDAEAGSNFHAKVVNDSGDLHVGTRSTSADTFLVSNRRIYLRTGASESNALFVNESGNVGIGTNSPSNGKLEISYDSDNEGIRVNDTRATPGANKRVMDLRYTGANGRTASGTEMLLLYDNNASSTQPFIVAQNNTGGVFTVKQDGSVGIGTTSPGAPLTVSGSNSDGVSLLLYNGVSGANPTIISNNASASTLKIKGGAPGSGANQGGQIDLVGGASAADAGAIILRAGTGTGEQGEKARIDSSGRLLVGTSTSIDADSSIQAFTTGVGSSVQVGRFSNNTGGCNIWLLKSRGGAVGSNAIVQSGDLIGSLGYRAANGSGYNTAAEIRGEVDGTPGVDDMPGRLVFSTTADGASSPTERMRIDSSGRLLVGTSSSSGNATTEIKGGTLSTTAATNKGGMLRVQSGAGNMSTASSITISDYFSIAPRRVMGVVYATTVDTSGHRTRSWKVYGKIGALSIVDDVNDSSSGGGSTPDLALAESASGVLTITPSWTFGGAGYVWSVDLLVGCAAS